MRILITKLLLLTTGIAFFCAVTRAQERPDPERLRAEARELNNKARDLKADGQTEESDRDQPRTDLRQRDRVERRTEIRRENNLPARHRQDERVEGQRRLGPPDHLAQDDRRLGRLDREELALRKFHLKKAIKHLHAAGLHEQADRLEERLRQAPLRFRNRPRERAREMAPEPERPERQPLDREPREER